MFVAVGRRRQVRAERVGADGDDAPRPLDFSSDTTDLLSRATRLTAFAAAQRDRTAALPRAARCALEPNCKPADMALSEATRSAKAATRSGHA